MSTTPSAIGIAPAFQQNEFTGRQPLSAGPISDFGRRDVGMSCATFVNFCVVDVVSNAGIEYQRESYLL
jgi:hypothetical protein